MAHAHTFFWFSAREIFSLKKKKTLKNFIYLLYLAFLDLSCSPKDLCCVTRDFSLRCMSSLVVTRRLRFSMACGILDPPPGTGPPSPTLPGAGLTTGPPRKSLRGLFCLLYLNVQFCPACAGLFSESLIISRTRQFTSFSDYPSCPLVC